MQPSISSRNSPPTTHASWRISRRAHGILDYLSGAVLVASAFVVPYPDGPMRMIAVALGLVLLLYSLGTDYEAGLLRFIPFPIHRGADLILGVMLLFSPIHFAVHGAPTAVFLIPGALLIFLSFCTRGAASTTGVDQPFVPGASPPHDRQP